MPHKIESLTDEETEAVLADARQSDPQWSNKAFYYNGYESRTDLHEEVAAAPAVPPLGPVEFHDGESELYWHPADQTWRLYEPESASSVGGSGLSIREGDTRSEKQRKYDKIKALASRALQRVSTFAKKGSRRTCDDVVTN